MKERARASVGAVVAAAVLLLPALGQGQAADPWTAPRTPWGEPDLQGIWTNATLTPLERPQTIATQYLTEAEAEELEQRTEESRDRADGTSRPGSVGGYNRVWLDPGTRVLASRRTSMITDPADGRIPWTEIAGIENRRERGRYGVGPYESWVDFDTGERCITDGLPMVPLQPYNMNHHILQAPGLVVILHEMYHEYRIIPVDGRPHLDSRIGQWLGDARGHWEGDTLVVETTNYADKRHDYWSAPWRKARPSLRMVERLTRVGPATIEYEFTIEDPTMFTSAWTAAAPMTTDQASRGVTSGQLFEYACHEGNWAIVNILRGARAEERALAAD